MASVVVNGDTSGAVTLSAPSVAGTVTVTLPATTGTMLTTASTTGISGSAISSGTVAEAYGGTGTSTGYYGFKNRIINGAMGIWQRGTTASLSNSYAYLTADRWETDMGSTAAATVSQSTSVPTATTQYSLKIQRTAASTSTGNIVAAQALETANSYDLAGSSITLSFWAKCGANYSATSSILGSFVFFGTGTDQSMSNMRSNAWTSQTNASQNNTVSTTWTRFTQTVSCPAGTTQVGMQFLFTPTGTAGADDSIFITGVQLEKGSTATSFDYRPFGTELALCQRYFCSSFPSTVAPAQNTGTAYNNMPLVQATIAQYLASQFFFPVAMRSVPTVTLYNPSAANAQARNYSTGTDCSSTNAASGNNNSFYIVVTPPASSGAGHTIGVNWSASIEL